MNFLIITQNSKIVHYLKDYGMCTVAFNSMDGYIKLLNSLFLEEMFDMIFFDISSNISSCYEVIELIKKERDFKYKVSDKKMKIIAIIDKYCLDNILLDKCDFIINKSNITENLKEIFFSLNLKEF